MPKLLEGSCRAQTNMNTESAEARFYIGLVPALWTYKGRRSLIVVFMMYCAESISLNEFA